MADASYALNYWKKVFINKAQGQWKAADFENWFWKNSEPIIRNVGYLPTTGSFEPGSDEHFSNVIRESFITMIDAASSGQFNK